MKSGPVAQFMPMAKRSRCAIETYSASIDWPASIVPIVSIDTDSTTGTLRPRRAQASSMPSSAGLDVERVLLRFEVQDIDTAFDERDGLIRIGRAHFVEGDAAGHRDRLRARAHRAGDEARPLRCRSRIRRLARQLRRNEVDLVHLVLQVVLGEHDARAAEGVGLDDVGAGVEIVAMDLLDHIRPRQHEMLVAALEAGPAEVIGREVARLDGRSHGAIEDEDAFLQRGAQRFDAVCW